MKIKKHTLETMVITVALLLVTRYSSHAAVMNPETFNTYGVQNPWTPNPNPVTGDGWDLQAVGTHEIGAYGFDGSLAYRGISGVNQSADWKTSLDVSTKPLQHLQYDFEFNGAVAGGFRLSADPRVGNYSSPALVDVSRSGVLATGKLITGDDLANGADGGFTITEGIPGFDGVLTANDLIQAWFTLQIEMDYNRPQGGAFTGLFGQARARIDYREGTPLGGWTPWVDMGVGNSQYGDVRFLRQGDINLDNVFLEIPEPATASLAALGGLVFLFRRR